MKYILLVTGLLVGMGSLQHLRAQDDTGNKDWPALELITYNIRMNTSSDGEHAWPFRKEDVFALFRFHRAAIFCVQEALPGQMDELAAAFPDFSYEGVGRDDGKRKGEFSAVFFQKDRFKRLEGGTFWLSLTPDVPGPGWDAALPRICSWVKLGEVGSGRMLYVFNTHFDHRGREARRQSARLIVQKIEEISGGEGNIVLAGDFNLSPGSEAIHHITRTFNDSYESSITPPYASTGTFHGFTYDDRVRDRIDYVFVSKGIRVLRYGALTDSRDRAFFSDHLPVLVTLDF
jgi:endonuclease/exonuclease/phosphatase family metal-dependent hydrolase